MAGLLASSPSALYGLVDMGSNGIRFSITALNPPFARTLPTLYQDRLGVSLYDAQYDPETNSKRPIPAETIDQVILALLRFKVVCADFGVSAGNVRVLATEATRAAENSEEFRGKVKERVGWDVDLLSKEMEGRVGAMGVASGFGEVEGLVLDLGGGSTQITYLLSQSGNVETSPAGSFSFPYGAAALTRLLNETDSSSNPALARTQLADKMKRQFQQAYQNLQLPERLLVKAKKGDLTLYLSGGGFRGWGYLLFSQHRISPYPIPIINGFTVSKHQFMQTANLEQLVRESALHAEEQSHEGPGGKKGGGAGLFRISKRRAAQVPAVAFLVNVLVSALEGIRDIRFCQGGVREGFLFESLPPEIRGLDPLTCATQQYGTPSAAQIGDLLLAALPDDDKTLDRQRPKSLTRTLCRAIADLMYLHQSVPKEGRAMAALYAPITGVLASVHGVSHTDRALLALVLCARWEGEVAPPHEDFVVRIHGILSKQEGWWAAYLGAVACFVGEVYPAGIVRDEHSGNTGAGAGAVGGTGAGAGEGSRIKLKAHWSEGLGKRGLEMGVKLKITCKEGDVVTAVEGGMRGWVEAIEKVGKRKKREAMERTVSSESGSVRSGGSGGSGSGSGSAAGGGAVGVGVRVEVDVERVQSLGVVEE